jgi:putative transposase
VADGLVYHAINRGNDRETVFFDDSDYRAFLRALAQTQLRYPFQLYAYCLMSNHFHLLLRPDKAQSISRILQSLTVAHTWRYHKPIFPP